jgi:pSer/pThr/pTyr-binding forkhead associated (FHA) protein
MKITLHIQDMSEPLPVPPGRQLVIGRQATAPLRMGPDIDLTACGAHGKGVAVRHAVLQVDYAGVAIVDLGSPSQTFVNGRIVPPGRAQPLQDRDEIRLGNLTMRIRIEKERAEG